MTVPGATRAIPREVRLDSEEDLKVLYQSARGFSKPDGEEDHHYGGLHSNQSPDSSFGASSDDYLIVKGPLSGPSTTMARSRSSSSSQRSWLSSPPASYSLSRSNSTVNTPPPNLQAASVPLRKAPSQDRMNHSYSDLPENKTSYSPTESTFAAAMASSATSRSTGLSTSGFDSAKFHNSRQRLGHTHRHSSESTADLLNQPPSVAMEKTYSASSDMSIPGNQYQQSSESEKDDSSDREDRFNRQHSGPFKKSRSRSRSFPRLDSRSPQLSIANRSSRRIRIRKKWIWLLLIIVLYSWSRFTSSSNDGSSWWKRTPGLPARFRLSVLEGGGCYSLEGSINMDTDTGSSDSPKWVVGDWAARGWTELQKAAQGLKSNGVGGLKQMPWAPRGQTVERPLRLEGVSSEAEEDLAQCRFISPVEAYHTDLRRLRAQQRQKERASRRTQTDLNESDDMETNSDQSEVSAFGRSRRSSSNTKQEGNTNHSLYGLFDGDSRSHHHIYSPSGHLIVSDDYEIAQHPIPHLLALGEKRWEEMLDRQSATLEEAVEEYERRYARKPPKGFDIWWDFAQAHNLVLPDEYDRIHLDLAPFWALPRAEIRKRAQQVEKVKETYTLAIKNGHVEIEIADEGGLAWEGTKLRAAEQASLVRAFARFMPNMRAVFSIHDHPQIYLSWARRNSLVELGVSGQHTTHLKESDNADVLWSRSCAPESKLRQKIIDDEEHSLVYDSLEAADICSNPYLLDLHGLTVEKHGPASHPRPHTSLLPLFSLAKTSVNSDILITPLDQFANGVGADVPWDEKSDSRLVWRGSTTGMSWMDQTTPWRKSHRQRLHFFAQNTSEAPIEFPAPDLTETRGPLKMRREEYTVSELAEFFYDMKLAGEPLQCNQTDGTCDEMKREIEFAPFQTPDELNQHKFLFDIDGNGWSGRFRRLMSTNSVVLKAGIFTEWFQPHLIPWFMYIPTRLDYSDLPTIMAFLRGTPYAPDEGFDEVARALAMNGKCFVNRMFRVEDLQAYMFRLFLEYARLIAPEGEDMDFHYTEEEYEYEEEPTDKRDFEIQRGLGIDILMPPPATESRSVVPKTTAFAP